MSKIRNLLDRSTYYARNHWLLILELIVMLAMVFSIALLTPMHSDDFSYQAMGCKFSTHLQHYLHWSGRVVADFTSTILLSCIKLPWIRALLNATCVAVLCLGIASLPNREGGGWNVPVNGYHLALIFLLYWLFNPNLGQTTFWVVGSANYLWTNLLIVIFLHMFLHYQNSESAVAQISVGILGLLAGLTNENSSVTLLVTLIAVSGILKWHNHHFKIGRNVIIPLAAVTIGATILLAAPGNYARLAHPVFANWQALTLTGKLHRHLARIRPWLAYFWPVYVIIALHASTLFSKGISNTKRQQNKYMLLWGLLFISAAVVSIAVLVAAPGLPARTMNTSLLFLLIATAFFLNMTTNWPWFFYLKTAILGTLLIIFGFSYTIMLASYRSTHTQAALRVDTITYHKQRGIDACTIPDFYFPRLLRKGDKFDLYHNAPSMGQHYGIKTAQVNRDVHFDYAIISNVKPIKIKVHNLTHIGQLPPPSTTVTGYVRLAHLLPFNRHTVVVDVTDLLPSLDEYTVIILKITNPQFTLEIPLKEKINIGAKIYTGTELASNLLNANTLAQLSIELQR